MSLLKKVFRLLLVEDSPGDVGIILSTLEECDYAVFEVDSVSSVKACRQALERGSFDLVLLDYLLPGENGLEFLRSVEKDSIPPVIMLTGQGDELVAKEAIRCGATDYCVKSSITPEALGRIIQGVLEDTSVAMEEKQRRADAHRVGARKEQEARRVGLSERKEAYGLTLRELTILSLLVDGHADKEIAVSLGISPLTVSKHVANILQKMGAHSRTEASARAIREALVN